METASSHRIRKCMLKLLALVIIAFGSTSAHAYLACNIQNGNKVLNAGYLSVPRNATPGQVVTTLPPEPFVMYCTFNTSAPNVTTGVLIATFTTDKPLVAGMTDVYQTNVAGLGVRYTVTANQCDEKTVTITNSTATLNCTVSGPLWADLPIAATVTTQFVATAPLAVGNLTLTSVPKLGVSYQTSVQPGTWGQTPVYIGTASGTIRQQSCSVQNSAQAITLPTVTARSLDSGAGTAAGSQPFSVDLSCPAGAQV